MLPVFQTDLGRQKAVLTTSIDPVYFVEFFYFKEQVYCEDLPLRVTTVIRGLFLEPGTALGYGKTKIAI